MSQESLKQQADRAENIADQMVDEALKDTLRDAANQYRNEADQEPAQYALFKGDIQLARTFPTEHEVLQAALAEGLVPDVQTADEPAAHMLPADYHIQRVERPYEPQPNWKLPREIE